MTKTESINQAIDRIKGRDLQPNTIVACKDNPFTHRFLRYENDLAICENGDSEEVSFPRTEIFDCKKLTNVANHLLNLGFWHEGMESMIIEIQPK